MDANWPPTWPKKAELHVFDPEGDVLLILDRLVVEDDLPESKSQSFQEGGTVPETPEPGWAEPELESESVLSEPESSAKLVAKKVQMRVSSRHLILASTTFRTSLTSDTYSEGRMLKAKGNVVIPLPDEDPDAMIILLNIIHPRSYEVPRRVDLNMLSKLAVTVNHRYMHEVVSLWSDTWIENLKKDEGLPSSYVPDKLLPWLFIFWAFRKDEDFKNVSQILGREIDDGLEDDLKEVYVGPYIPASIIQVAQENRIDVIESMVALIHDRITKYSGPNILCNNGKQFACDANVLGSLLKASAVIGIYPRPEDPYPGINIKTLSAKIRGIQILDYYDRRSTYHISSHSHGIKTSIEASVDSLENSIQGLDLRSFLPEVRKLSKKG